MALRDYVQNRGWELTTEYVDHGVSGSKDSRPQLDKLMKDARARKLDVVIVTNSAWPQADWDPGYEAVSAFSAAVQKALRNRTNRAY